jgi:CHAT domain-containing protein
MHEYFHFLFTKSKSRIFFVHLVFVVHCGCWDNEIQKKDTIQSYSRYLALAEKSYDNHHLDSTFYYLSILRSLPSAVPKEKDSSRVGLFYTLFGFYFEDRNMADSALYYHQLAYREKVHYFKENHPEISKSINNVGLLYQRYGAYKLAGTYFKLAISQVSHLSSYRNEWVKYHLNLANNYYLENDFDASLKILNEISRTAEKEHLVNIYLSKGNNYLGLKRTDEARSYFQKAYHLEKKNLRKKAQIANNIGNAYSILQREKSALYYYQKSLKIRNKVNNITNNELGEIYGNIASSLLKMDEWSEAESNFNIAKNYFLLNKPINQAALSGIEENMGLLYLKRFNPEAALTSFHRAQFIHDSILHTPEPENSRRYLHLASLFFNAPFRDTAKGIYYLNKISGKANDFDKINKLLILIPILMQQNNIKEATTFLSELRGFIHHHKFEIEINQIELLLKIAALYEEINQIKEAYKINSRGFTLLNQLKDKSGLRFYQNLYTYYLTKTHLDLRMNRIDRASQIAKEIYFSIDSIQKTNNILRQDRLINEIKINFIDLYFEAKSSDKIELIKAFTFPHSENKIPVLDSQNMLIRYWATNDKLIIWSKRAEKCEVLVKHVDVPLTRNILSLRNALTEIPFVGEKSKNNYDEIYDHLVQQLSTLLVPSIPSGVKELIIFPDKILTILPFEILQDEEGEGKLLLEQYAISYFSIPENNLIKRSKHVKNKVLAFSPNFKDDRRGFSYLKYSDIELDGIKRHMPMVSYKDKSAGVLNFIEEAPRFNIIHIATHSEPNLNDERGGALIFSENDAKNEPSSLYAVQISQLNIRANLVVLSACQSAIGNYTPTQGMNSIAQSFLNGGALSVITSLWQVDDRSTSQFMTTFYYYLSKGYPKTKALQITKKKMIKQSPYYWAPFILIGDTGGL